MTYVITYLLPAHYPSPYLIVRSVSTYYGVTQTYVHIPDS